MKNIELLGLININNGEVTDGSDPFVICRNLSNYDADGIIIVNAGDTIKSFTNTISKITSDVDIDVFVKCVLDHTSDAMTLIHEGGAKKIIFSLDNNSDIAFLDELVSCIGADKIIIDIKDESAILKLINKDAFTYITDSPAKAKDITSNTVMYTNDSISILDIPNNTSSIVYIDNLVNVNFVQIKKDLEENGYATTLAKCSIPFSKLKLNESGMIPVIVQDFKTNEVLMLAYMNEESYNLTMETGIMTYYSRSRQELWKKGLTSGHFQYVKSMELDCDNDTLLARVYQVGAACHTNSRSCFFTNIYKKKVK